MTTVIEKIHALITGSHMAEEKNLSGKNFIVTGCATGSLGFATAFQLLSQGAVVSITARKNSEQLIPVLQQQLDCQYHNNINAFDMNLAERDSVDAFVQSYQERGLALDVLINNAGIHLDLLSKWTQPKLSSDGFEMQWRVNYLGTAHLTQGLLPLLQLSGAEHGDARIVNVVSQLHSKGLNNEFFTVQRPYNSWFVYGQSKLALVHLTRSIARRFEAQGISSYCLHPGSVYTNVASTGLADTGWVEAIRNLFAPLEKLFLKTAKEGAQTQIYCATSDKQTLQSGAYYRNLTIEQASPEADDQVTADKLWQLQQIWINS